MLLAPAAALEDLGTLILGDHALDLNQEVLCRVISERIAQEDDFNTAMAEFFKDQDLIRIFS